MGNDENIYTCAKRLCTSVESLLNRLTGNHGLNASQGYLLLYIGQRHQDGTFMTDLQKELGFSAATISCGVKKLRQEEYLTVETSSEDERLKRLIPTAKSREMAEKLLCGVRRIESAVCGNLTEEEQEILLQLLQKSVDGITDMENSGRKETGRRIPVTGSMPEKQLGKRGKSV